MNEAQVQHTHNGCVSRIPSENNVCGMLYALRAMAYFGGSNSQRNTVFEPISLKSSPKCENIMSTR